MSYYHHGSIRKYVASLLNTFNDVEVQHKNSASETISKNVPIVYSSREKSRILDTYTSEQILSGNYNVLPRCSLALTGMSKSSQRTTNKNVKINNYKTESTIEYLYNSVPYEFTFDLIFKCRGMNEATQIIEQICPKFNPTINIDIFDSTNLDEATRVPISLVDISIETDEYDDLTSNIFTVTFNLSLQGNLYPPIKTIERIKEFKMRFNEYDTDDYTYNRKSILNWDVDENGELENEEKITITSTSQYPPVISSITAETSVVGENNISVSFEDKDNTIDELTFEWDIIYDETGSAELIGDNDTAILTIDETGTVEIQVTITDPYGNYASMNKTIEIE